MSHSQFYEMIELVPRVSDLWDQDKNALKVDEFEQELSVMSSGEVAMAQFFASVWFHNNKRYGFDLADIASRIDSEHRTIIANWVIDPFYP